MKSKTRKLRDRASRLGQTDPTLTAGVSRDAMNAFYKLGGRTATKQGKMNKENKRYKAKLKQMY